MLYRRLDFSQFMEEVERLGRTSQFTRSGWRCIFEHLGGLDDDIELDIIAICCDFEEYTSFDEILNAYGLSSEDVYDDLLEYLEQRTTVIKGTQDHIILYAF